MCIQRHVWTHSTQVLCHVMCHDSILSHRKQRGKDRGRSRNWVVHWHLSLPLSSSRTLGDKLRRSHPSHVTSVFLPCDVKPLGASHCVLHLWFRDLYAFAPTGAAVWQTSLVSLPLLLLFRLQWSPETQLLGSEGSPLTFSEFYIDLAPTEHISLDTCGFKYTWTRVHLKIYVKLQNE